MKGQRIVLSRQENGTIRNNERLSLKKSPEKFVRKNGLFDEKERLIQIERTAYSMRKNGLFPEILESIFQFS